jgi:hypothetical protein
MVLSHETGTHVLLVQPPVINNYCFITFLFFEIKTGKNASFLITKHHETF